MFIILLKFSDKKSHAGQFMQAHKEWLQQGFDDGIFLLSGSIQPSAGGGILAFNTTHDELLKRVNKDPFVVENVARAEIIEIAASKANEQLNFLLNPHNQQLS